MIKILKMSLVLMLFSCGNVPEEKSIVFKLLSDTFIRDTVIFEGKQLTLNEYYQVSIENMLYDTVYFSFGHLHNSKVKSIQSSHIVKYRDGKVIGDQLIFTGKPDYIVAISRFNTKACTFLLPDLSDSSIQKKYHIFFDYDSLGTIKSKYIPLEFNLKDRKIFKYISADPSPASPYGAL